MAKSNSQNMQTTGNAGTQEIERVVLQLFQNGHIKRQDVLDLGNVLVQLSKELPDTCPIIH